MEMEMAYDDHAHDRAIAREDAMAEAADARLAAERKDWLAANDWWIRKDFMEAHAELFASYQQAQWEEFCGGEE